MATQQTQPANTKAKTAPKSAPAHKEFVFSKQNYQILAVGVCCIVIGFILMSGGGTTDPRVFDYSKIYNWTRIDLSTIFVIGGFAINMFAIMYKPKTNTPDQKV